MRNSASTASGVQEGAAKAAPAGTQTLLRGLDVLDAVSRGPVTLAELALRLGLTRSTTHRLASSLVERRYLNFTPREGYSLGPKLIQLGFCAQQDNDLPRVARPFLEQLASSTGDTVHLGVLEGRRALYLDKLPGRRRIEISSRVGELQPLRSTGLGKAMLLDESTEGLLAAFDVEAGSPSRVDRAEWLARMRNYAGKGYAYDLEENEDRIRCVAAPVRGVSGKIIGAISVSSAAQYMDDQRMTLLTQDVTATAEAISRELGWSGE